MNTGQTLNDRILAAKHSLAGQGLAKAVCKATTEELIGPKKKHLDCKTPSYASSLSFEQFAPMSCRVSNETLLCDFLEI